MIRGVRAHPQHFRVHGVSRRSALTSAMATSARTAPGDRRRESYPVILAGAGVVGGQRNNAHQDRLRTGSGCAAAVPTGVCDCWNGDRSAEAARPFVSIRCASRGSRSKDLGGETKAHGRVGHRSSETARAGTDPSRSKALKSTLTARCGLNGGCGNANPGDSSSAARERQEGRRPW